MKVKVRHKKNSRFYLARLATTRADKDIIRQFDYLSSIPKHKNIISVYDTFKKEVLITDYYEGNTLQDKVEDNPLPLEVALNIFYQCCDGLRHIHK